MSTLRIIVPLLLSASILHGCSRSERFGVYINSSEPLDYLELKSNQTFHLSQADANFEGTFQVDQSTRILHLEGERAFRFEIRDSVLVGREGRLWTYWRGGSSSLQYEKTVRANLVKQREQDKKRSRLFDLLSSIAIYAHEHRTRPISKGGGGGSYLNYKLPDRFANAGFANVTSSSTRDSLHLTARLASDPESGVVVTIDSAGEFCNWRYLGDL